MAYFPRVFIVLLALSGSGITTQVPIRSGTGVRPQDCELLSAEGKWHLENFKPYRPYRRGQHVLGPNVTEKSREDIILVFHGLPVSDRRACEVQFRAEPSSPWLEVIRDLRLTVFLLDTDERPRMARDITPEQHRYVGAMLCSGLDAWGSPITIGSVDCRPSMTFRICVGTTDTATATNLGDGVDLTQLLQDTLRLACDCRAGHAGGAAGVVERGE